MQKLRRGNPAFILIFILSLNPIFALTAFSETSSIKTITVAGFINKGSSEGENINIILTKSLIGTLEKIPNSIITPYSEVEKIVSENGLWKLKKIDIDLALQTAQPFGSRQLIIGEYKVNPSANQVSINVYVYDVITGELKLKRNYRGNTGLDLFDTIDNIAKNIGGLILGKKFSLGRVVVKIQDSTNNYIVNINAKNIGTTSEEHPFETEILSGETVEISLKISNSDKEVFRKAINVASSKTNEIIYTPYSSLNIQNLLNDGIILINEKPCGSLEKEQSLIISNILPDKTYNIALQHNEKILQKREVVTKEGETALVVFAEKRGIKKTPFHYADSSPMWNLLLPGIAQYQAGDFWMGTLFLSLDLASIGWTTLFIVAYNILSDKYNQSADQAYKDKLSYLKDKCLVYISLGIIVWAGATTLSILHAYSEMAAEIKPEGYSLSLDYDVRSNEYKLYIKMAF